MKKALTVPFLLLILSCGPKQVDLKEAQIEIEKCWADWPKKSESGNPAFYFADDAIITGQMLPTIKGMPEIVKFYASMPKVPGQVIKWNAKPNIIGFSKDGEMGYSVDTLQFILTDTTGLVQTKINQGIHVWEKNNEGNWRVSFLTLYPKN